MAPAAARGYGGRRRRPLPGPRLRRPSPIVGWRRLVPDRHVRLISAPAAGTAPTSLGPARQHLPTAAEPWPARRRVVCRAQLVFADLPGLNRPRRVAWPSQRDGDGEEASTWRRLRPRRRA